MPKTPKPPAMPKTPATPNPRPLRKLMRALTVVLIISSVVIEWLFLTGTPPSGQALAEAFLPAAPEAPVLYTRPSFQTGVIFPRWGANAYTHSDRNYGIGLGEIHDQTGAHWIELSVNFYQTAYDATSVYAGPHTPTPGSLEEGIRMAHERGFKVFIEPLIALDTPAPNGSSWAGAITFSGHPSDTPKWFEGYWQALKPYFVAAQRAHADQMAIGAEYADLESAPDIYWYWLIAQARSVYSGHITYDMNFTSLLKSPREWMRDPNLSQLGVSMYMTLAGPNEPIPLSSLPERWAASAGRQLDAFAVKVGRPLFISEIGYRNSADALFHPYAQTSDQPPDPQLQAAAYNAALMYALSDPHVNGIYFWAWSLPPFSPNWLPAARTLKSWYHSPLA